MDAPALFLPCSALNLDIPDLFLGCPALFLACSALFLACPALFLGCSTLFLGSSSLFLDHPALCLGCPALSLQRSTLLSSHPALSLSCSALLLGSPALSLSCPAVFLALQDQLTASQKQARNDLKNMWLQGPISGATSGPKNGSKTAVAELGLDRIWEFFGLCDAAGLDGASGARETSGGSLGAEKIRERTLCMTARMALTRAGAQDASAAVLAHQRRS